MSADITANCAEELEIIRQILAFEETGTTHMEDAMMENPVTHYTDRVRYEAEVHILFRQFPLILGHVSQVASPGEYFTHNDTGVPILVTRNSDGVVKAFVNVCRHRGARVVGEPCGQAHTFSCPYHRWTYDLDGALLGMPQPIGFAELDKSARGLVELPVFERYGLIWGRPSPLVEGEKVDIDSWLEPMAGQLNYIDLAAHTIYKTWSVETQMSWRIALEGFQESYHFCTAHQNTACATYLDNQSLFLDKYPHVRHAVPLADVGELRAQPESSWDYRAKFMTQNYLFPCNFVQVMTDHVYVHTIVPTGPESCVFHCMMLIPPTAALEKPAKYWDANYQVVRKVFAEDFAIGEAIQTGFEARANTEFLFGRYEAGLHLGQRAINDALTGRLKF